jgi:hypothetical protein
MRAYLCWLGGMTLLLLAAAATLNFAVDPFGIRQGDEDDAPVPLPYVRIAQGHFLAQRPASVLLLGTSRAQMGLDPRHPALGAGRRFNAGRPAEAPLESLHLFRQALESGELRRVVWALDFLIFGCGPPPPGHDLPVPDAWDRVAQLVHGATLEASLRTLQDRWSGVQPWARLRRDGAMEVNPARFFAAQGPRELTLGSERNYIVNVYLSKYFLACRDKPDPADHYRALLTLAHRARLDLHLLISPSHARQWEALRASGLWDVWEDWKRRLVRINAEEAARAGADPFPLWDFSGFTTLTTEPFPAPGDREARMRWYWESSHFNMDLGNLVLDRVLDHREPGRAIPADFGVRLGPGNVEAHLAAVRADRERWAKAFPADVREIAEITAEVRR